MIVLNNDEEYEEAYIRWQDIQDSDSLESKELESAINQFNSDRDYFIKKINTQL